MEFSLEEELGKSSEEQADFDQQVELAELSPPEISQVLNRQSLSPFRPLRSLTLRYVTGIVDTIANNAEAVLDQTVFNTFRSFLM